MTKTLEELKKEIELIQSQSNDKIQELIKQYEVEKEKKEEFVIVERTDKDDYYYCIYDMINDDENAISYYCDYHDTVDTRYYDSNNYFHTREEAGRYLKRFLLELKILRTRDKINGGWKPDWKDKRLKYVIVVDYNSVEEQKYYNYNQTLAFQSEEKRKQFRELISDEEIIEFLSF